MSNQKVIKTGNSLAITIPAEFVKILGIKSGQIVQVCQNIGKGYLRFQFHANKQLPLLSVSGKIRTEKNKKNE